MGIFGTNKYVCFTCGVIWEDSRGLFGDDRSRCNYCKKLRSPLSAEGEEILFPEEYNDPGD